MSKFTNTYIIPGVWVRDKFQDKDCEKSPKDDGRPLNLCPSKRIEQLGLPANGQVAIVEGVLLGPDSSAKAPMSTRMVRQVGTALSLSIIPFTWTEVRQHGTALSLSLSVIPI